MTESYFLPRTSLWMQAALLGAALLGCGTSLAQVQRCTDLKTGRITYTNGSCIAGEAGRQVQQAQTPEQIAQERSQAQAAIAREKELTARNELERSQREAQERKDFEAWQRDQAKQRSGQNAGDSAACRQTTQRYNAILAEADPDLSTWGDRSIAAQRQMELACLGPAGYSQLEQARVLRPNAINRVWYGAQGRPVLPAGAPTPPITHCNVFRCYDAKGGVHARP